MDEGGLKLQNEALWVWFCTVLLSIPLRDTLQHTYYTLNYNSNASNYVFVNIVFSVAIFCSPNFSDLCIQWTSHWSFKGMASADNENFLFELFLFCIKTESNWT